MDSINDTLWCSECGHTFSGIDHAVGDMCPACGDSFGGVLEPYDEDE